MTEHRIELETAEGRWDITDRVVSLRIDWQQRWGLRFPRAPEHFDRVLEEQEISITLETIPLHMLPAGWEGARALLHLTAPDAAPITAIIDQVNHRWEYAVLPDGSISEHGWHIANEIEATALRPGQPVPHLQIPRYVSR